MDKKHPAVNRRDFFEKSAALGVSATAASGQDRGGSQIRLDHVADLVIAGAGAAGLPASLVDADPPRHANWLENQPEMPVIDVHEQVIPGLYCAGESAGGFALHGLPRVTVFGRIAGREAARANSV